MPFYALLVLKLATIGVPNVTLHCNTSFLSTRFADCHAMKHVKHLNSNIVGKFVHVTCHFCLRLPILLGLKFYLLYSLLMHSLIFLLSCTTFLYLRHLFLCCVCVLIYNFPCTKTPTLDRTGVLNQTQDLAASPLIQPKLSIIEDPVVKSLQVCLKTTRMNIFRVFKINHVLLTG